MSIATISSKGQITIPVEIRNGLGLSPGDKINFIMQGESVMFVPSTKSISALKGMITAPKTPVTLEDMKTTIKSRASKI